jgi:hypothetical protein
MFLLPGQLKSHPHGIEGRADDGMVRRIFNPFPQEVNLQFELPQTLNILLGRLHDSFFLKNVKSKQ